MGLAWMLQRASDWAGNLSLMTRVHIHVWDMISEHTAHPQACLTSVFSLKMQGGSGIRVKWMTLSTCPGSGLPRKLVLDFYILVILASDLLCFIPNPPSTRQAREWPEKFLILAFGHEFACWSWTHSCSVLGRISICTRPGPSAVHQGWGCSSWILHTSTLKLMGLWGIVG